MSTVTDPVWRTGMISGITILGAIVSWVMLALFTSPVLYAAIQIGPIPAGFWALGVFGFGLWFSQILMEEESRESFSETSEMMDEAGLILQILFSLVTVLFYNVLLLFSTVFAMGLAQVVGLEIAAIFAFIYPAYDLWITEKGIPLSISGLLAIGIAIGVVVMHIREHINWKEDWKTIHFDRLFFRILGRGPGRTFG